MVDTLPAQTVELFVDLLNRPDGRFARVGYRPVGSEQALICVELPIQLLEQAVASGLDLTTRITPSGEVVCDIHGWSETALSDLRLVTSIDLLISQMVSPDNLRLEEASLAELNELLKSLELGIEQVKAALRRTSVEV
jgi:hypothetical protein